MENWNGIISLLIACIELIFLVNLFVFAEKNRTNKMAAILIFLLMAYQTLEFLMCHLNLQFSFLPYAAFVDISFLPPLSLMYILNLFGYKSKYFKLFFAPAILFFIYYTFAIPKFIVTSCAVFYATYNYPYGDLYGLFYYLLVLAAMIFLIIKTVTSSGKEKFYSIIFLGAHFCMAVPVATAFVLASLNKPEALDTIESVMCKFAFGYATALTYVILMIKNNE